MSFPDVETAGRPRGALWLSLTPPPQAPDAPSTSPSEDRDPIAVLAVALDADAAFAIPLTLAPDDQAGPTDPGLSSLVGTEGLSPASQECYNRAAPNSPEVRMRPYRLIDEAPDEEDELPRVVPIGAGGRSRTTPYGFGARRRPWTPRESVVPTPAPRAVPSPLVSHDTGLSRTHRLMIASFVIICAGMILGMLMVRVWDEASRAVAALPPEGSAAPSRANSAQPAPLAPVAAPGAPIDENAPQGAGAITTEIRVLQPNYTVARGDTLGIIARRHGTNVDALASINNLENRNSLSVGQKRIIP